MEIKTQLVPMSAKEIEMFLTDCRAQVGHLATINADGYPYVLPLHFVYLNGRIYVHGSHKGLKIDNIKLNDKVGFEIEFMDEIIPHSMPCMANTTFTSVVMTGTAVIVQDAAVKQKALDLFVEKYLPPGKYENMPQKVIDITGLIEITPIEITAKSRIVAG